MVLKMYSENFKMASVRPDQTWKCKIIASKTFRDRQGLCIRSEDGEILIIGNPATLSPDFNNEFIDCQIGIGSRGNELVEIERNRIASQTGLAYNIGIIVRESVQDSRIANNDIRAFKDIGIQSRDWSNMLTIEANHVETFNDSSDITTGILVTSPNNQGFVTIHNNNVREMQRGIVLSSVGSSAIGTSTVSNNTVVFALPSASTEPAAGIFLRDSPDTEVRSNYVDGMCSSCTDDVRAIFTQWSTGLLFEDNEVTTTKYGFYFEGTCTETNMVCNQIINCPMGVTFDNVGFSDFGPVEGLSASGSPAGNCWEPEFSALRTFASNGSIGTSFDWYFTNTYDNCQEMVSTPPTLFNNFDGMAPGSALIPISSSGPDDCGFILRYGLESQSTEHSKERDRQRMLGIADKLPESESICSFYDQKNMIYRYFNVNYPSLDLSTYEYLGFDEMLNVDQSVATNDYGTAQIELSLFTPSCSQGTNYKKVKEIGLDMLQRPAISNSISSFTANYLGSELTELLLLSNGNPRVQGNAVFLKQSLC